MAGSSIEKLHEKINYKGMLEQFLDIMIVRFQESMIKHKVKSKDRAYQSFKKALFYTGGNVDKAQMTFLAYSRMVDMGVGKGVNWVDQKYAKSYWGKKTKERTGRKAKKWYSKTKGHQIKRLREILAKQYGIGLLAEVEQSLTMSVTVNNII